jgi:hypothetical protein
VRVLDIAWQRANDATGVLAQNAEVQVIEITPSVMMPVRNCGDRSKPLSLGFDKSRFVLAL